MKKMISGLVFVSLLFSYTACQKKINPVLSPPSGTPITFCIDILGKEEPIFTQPVLKLLAEMEKEQIITLHLESCQNKADYIETLTRIAKTTSFVITGALMAEEVATVASLYPNCSFLVLDFPMDSTNVSSLVFREEDMAKRAMALGRNQSTTKKIGAMFLGEKEASLSKALWEVCQPAEVSFLSLENSSQQAFDRLQLWKKEGIDFVYLARAPYLESIVLSESKTKSKPIQIICPRLILPEENQKTVFAFLEKNYRPLLEKILKDMVHQKKQGQIYWSTDFSLVLTR